MIDSKEIASSIMPKRRDRLVGAATFVDDIHFPGQLWGSILRSPYPHARIVKMDTTRAKSVPGIKCVLTGRDLPSLPYGPSHIKDWNILSDDRLLFIGDEVAAVAGTSREAVQRALAEIEVEYEQLEAVFDPEEALGPGASQVHPEVSLNNEPMSVSVQRGDVDEAFAKADIVKGGRFKTNRIYQGYLEPNGVVADWNEDNLTLWAPTHIPYRAREAYAAALGIFEEQLRIIVPEIGGSFGGKYILKLHVIAAALARECKAPVKIVLDRKEDMIASNPRVPLTIDVKIAASKDGMFLGKDVVVYADAGSRVYWSPNVLATACTRVDSLYNFHNVRAKGHLCYTNHSPTTCMRGFGNAEMLFALENVIDEIANELDMDPAELRLKNVVHKGEVTIHGYELDSCEIETCIEKVCEISDWSRRREELTSLSREEQSLAGVSGKSLANLQTTKRRGIGIGIANHVSGYSGIDKRFDGAVAVARLDVSGQIVIDTGEIDLGQGLSETYQKIAAKTLNISEEAITIRSGDTDTYPFGIGTLASRGTVMGGNAVHLAAAKLIDEITNAARQMFGPSAACSDGTVNIETPDGNSRRVGLGELAKLYNRKCPGSTILSQGRYIPHSELPNKDFYGNPSPSYPFGAHVAEVEVDTMTGRVKVLNYWAVHDSGIIINHVGAQSQILGAIAQGVGWALMEDLTVASGAVQNPTFMDYRLPGMTDMPTTQIEFIEQADEHGPMGAKSLSEAALDPVVAAITNAIAHAVGKRSHSLPVKPEVLWRLIHER